MEGLRGLLGARTELRWRQKNPPQMLELQVESLGRLHPDCIPPDEPPSWPDLWTVRALTARRAPARPGVAAHGAGPVPGGQPRHEAHRHRAAHGSGAMLSWELERALAPRFERVLRSCPNTPWAGSKLQQNRFPLLWRELKRVCRGTRADVLVLASQQREEMGGRRSTPEFTVGTCNPIVGPIGCTMIRSGQRLSASNRRLLVLLDGFIDTRPPPKLQSGYAGVEAHRLNPLTRQQP